MSLPNKIEQQILWKTMIEILDDLGYQKSLKFGYQNSFKLVGPTVEWRANTSSQKRSDLKGLGIV